MIDLGQATNLAELLEAVRSAGNRFADRQLWCRGHASKDWKLIPSAHRYDPVLESLMANHFRLRAPALRRDCPAHSEYLAWLPLMRHYGLPTRLLDWTESICVAAFFATKHKPKPGPSVVWMLSPGHLNHYSIGDIVPFLHDNRVKPIAEAAFSRLDAPHTVAAMAPRHDARMAAQLGNFTVHGSREPLEEHTNAANFLAKIEIPKSAQDRVNYDLVSAGMRLSNLFPDLDHLAEELSELCVI